jgi:UDP-N-acetylglucosamine 2-epimerase (non-hydrolysing)
VTVRAGPLVFVAGARPNFMKVAPVLRAARRLGLADCRLVHTGQHYDERMSRLFFDELHLPRPDRDLEVGSGPHGAQTARILERFAALVEEWRPRRVVVVGDVNSTLACALAAAKLDVPVAHVEAGLRSFDRTMPEELNRMLTDELSDLRFVSEPAGLCNLAREGLAGPGARLVGNVMIDTLLEHRPRAASRPLPRGLRPREFAVLTLHRPANVDRPAMLAELLRPVLELAAHVPVVFPVHPRARPAIEAALGGEEAHGLQCVEPLGYMDFLGLMDRARLVLTDSGGIQEETTILGVPCITVRDNTERPITVERGTNRLAGTSSAGVRAAIAAVMAAPFPAAPASPPLWDGSAGARIAADLA